MNLDFSDDQKLLRDQALRMLTDTHSLASARGMVERKLTDYAPDVWKQMRELGFTACSVDTQYGGLGLGTLELCVLSEALGRHLAPTPFFSSICLAAQGIELLGSEEQKSKWLPGLASGEVIGTLAIAESSGVWSAKRISAEFANGAISGLKIAVPDGGCADVALIVARNQQGEVGLYLVDLQHDGVQRAAHNSLDASKPIASLQLKNVPAEVVKADGWGDLQKLLDRAAVLCAFEQIGGAEACLDMAKGYALERKAFGRQIASYQALKHRMADIYIKNTLARSNAYYAAWALSTEAEQLPEAAAAARISAIDAYDFASSENIQIHGGMGFTWEFDCHLYYRRARALAVSIGSQGHWKRKLLSALRSKQVA